jgi:hypothetical protein
MALNNLDTSLSEDTTHKEAKAKAFLNRLLLKNSYVVEIKIDKGWTTVLLTNFLPGESGHEQNPFYWWRKGWYRQVGFVPFTGAIPH